jgi:hypothetical protein
MVNFKFQNYQAVCSKKMLISGKNVKRPMNKNNLIQEPPGETQ